MPAVWRTIELMRIPRFIRSATHRAALITAVLWMGAAAFTQPTPAPAAPAPVAPPRFRYMGPESAGRIAAVAGVAGDPDTYYAGAASGGVWKSIDGAQTFEPVFDDQPVQAIGSL